MLTLVTLSPPRNLQRSVPDKGKLKYLTGEWFYETKSRRHRDRIHGSDIIRASMRQKKTVTICESLGSDLVTSHTSHFGFMTKLCIAEIPLFSGALNCMNIVFPALVCPMNSWLWYIRTKGELDKTFIG